MVCVFVFFPLSLEGGGGRGGKFRVKFRVLFLLVLPSLSLRSFLRIGTGPDSRRAVELSTKAVQPRTLRLTSINYEARRCQGCQGDVRDVGDDVRHSLSRPSRFFYA